MAAEPGPAPRGDRLPSRATLPFFSAPPASWSKRFFGLARQNCVTRLALALCLLAPLTAPAATVDLTKLLSGVERRYNNAKTLEIDFTQKYSMNGKGQRPETGTLYLLKPGRMRWEYQDPAGKLFLTDGQNAYFYSPNANRVERSKMKETDDVRAPFAFLLGKLDFQREFNKFYTREEGSNVWISAVPKSEKRPYERVEFLVTPDYEIRTLRIIGQDQSVMDFDFRQERRNLKLAANLFQFQAPPGAEIVEVTDP
jgi:outer membrane lipoprotein carrier protein